MTAAKKVVLITGGASGIGFELGKRLAEKGCFVVLADRSGEAVVQAAAELGEEHLGVYADVTDNKSLEAALRKTLQRYSQLDVVVANAGVGSASTVRATSLEQLENIFQINLLGQVRTAKAMLEALISSRGYIVFTGSAAVMKNAPKSSAYAAAKAGVEAFAGAMRMELSIHGVDVGVFYPGWTRTPLISGSKSRAGASKSMPWPFSVTNEVGDVADRYAEMVEHRERSAYVPGYYRAVHWLKPLFTNSYWDRRQRKTTEANVRNWESVIVQRQQ